MLCLRSVQQHYPEHTHHVTIIADDVQCDPWHDYVQDLHRYLALYVQHYCVIPTSSLPKIRDCVAGWWRQQLVKLTLDHIMPDDAWFVVDGDVIFRSRCEMQHVVPISRRVRHDRWSTMCANYVQGMLGTAQGMLQDRDSVVITSAIPFRCVQRNLLQQLRAHCEQRFQDDFVDLHLTWYQDQTIVADIDPPTRWVMSEWELMECFRRYVMCEIWPYNALGSGYQIAAAAMSHGFTHSYQRDTEIGEPWFQQQGIPADPDLWHNMCAWSVAQESHRST